MHDVQLEAAFHPRGAVPCPNSTLLNETETLVCLWPLQLSCVEEGGLGSVTMQVSTM